MGLKAEAIVSVMEQNGAVPPLVVWEVGIMDIIDGVPRGGIPGGQHGKKHNSMIEAAEELVSLSSINIGTDKLVTSIAKIVDSTGKQVYP